LTLGAIPETRGYHCGCVYKTKGDYVYEAVFCPQHKVALNILLERMA
jgi:hypothetical protein